MPKMNFAYGYYCEATCVRAGGRIADSRAEEREREREHEKGSGVDDGNRPSLAAPLGLTYSFPNRMCGFFWRSYHFFAISHSFALCSVRPSVRPSVRLSSAHKEMISRD